MNLLKKVLSLIKSVNREKFIRVGNKKLYVPEDMRWCFSGSDYYETNVIYWLDKLIGLLGKPVFYDIGANMGYYSVRFSGIAEEVYSFEPVNSTFSFLQKNIGINKLLNVTPFNLALSNEKGDRLINLYSSCGNNSVFNRNIPVTVTLNKIGQQNISMVTLDELIIEKHIKPPGIVKIDVEGSELFVLKGMTDTIERFKPVLLMEYSADTCRDAGYEPEKLIEEIHTYDYAIFGIPETVSDLELINFSDLKTTPPSNIIAVPRSLVKQFNL